jgi:hypothetical protein
MLGKTVRNIAAKSVMSSFSNTRRYPAFGFILGKSVIAFEEVLAQEKCETPGGMLMKPITLGVWGRFPTLDRF